MHNIRMATVDDKRKDVKLEEVEKGKKSGVQTHPPFVEQR